MPIRIKPSHDFGPCVLTLESVQSIADLVEKNFPNSIFSANEGVWEIYNEPKESFLPAISQRDTLDSFQLSASTGNNHREISIVFNEEIASIECIASPDQLNWFEHFMIDLKKYILPPTFIQLMVHKFGKGGFYLRLPFLFVPIDTSMYISTPYCRIVICKRPPNPFVENIKANLVSNIIWAILIFVLGIAATLATQGITR